TINVTRAGEGEHWLFGGDLTTIKASGRHTSGDLLVLEVTVSPGGGPPGLHRHEYTETLLFQEGEFEVSTLEANGSLGEITVAAGDTVAIPSMAWHNFKNVGDGPGRFVVVHSPAVMEEVVHEIGQRIDDPESPPEPDGPPSEEQMRRMMEVIGRHIEMLPPDKMPNS
ncbi:MAG TPA: cupin domain-containing protein, partial [Rubrobacter sp.]|nr:cupin domain-containing protein [Rubrobacter sp.]